MLAVLVVLSAHLEAVLVMLAALAVSVVLLNLGAVHVTLAILAVLEVLLGLEAVCGRSSRCWRSSGAQSWP